VTLLHLPDVEHLPVVFAVRMSLSFPLLLSAVPLWAVDYGGTNQAEPVWFSDGGITSNFPVHFFDALLPTRPTFAINLGPGEHLDPSDQRRNIVVPTRAASGILPRWTHINGVFDFGRAILDTMQNWSDNNQARMPGYRDRIISVLHARDEGGLNLDMGPTTITDLSARGEAAAIEFLNFDLAQHRWTRYRSSMALLERTAAAYLASYNTAIEDVPTYGEMIDDPPRSYSSDWSRPKAAFARERTESLLGLSAAWPDERYSFTANEPSPAPILRVTPDV
jgi:predicted acylesterase/phospholipase RssA